MNSNKTTRFNWQGLVPRGRPGAITLIIVAVVAFLLGGLLLGAGKPTESARDSAHGDAVASEASAPAIWTCSMHPQIQLPKPGKCPICFMDLIPVETGSDSEELAPAQIRLSETAVELSNIQTTPVVRAFAERSIRMVGKLDYDETKVAYITAWIPGRLDRLFVDYTGAHVSKGDRLVHIYSPELIATQEELLQAIKAMRAIENGGSQVLRSTAVETVASAREKLRLYGLSDEQIADIERAGRPESHLTINAPIGGVVVHKDATEGMYVQTGTRIYTVADLARLWVLLEAYESDLPWLKKGQHVTFTSPSFPGETFDAVISFIDPVVDPKTRTVRVRAVVENRGGRLKPQMFVSGQVRSRLDGDGGVMSSGLGFSESSDTRGKAPLLIPATAPLVTGKRAVVYVETPSDKGPIFEGRQVELGPRAGEYYVVREGLDEGELVVTNGAFKIDSELQIQGKPSMMSPRGAPAATGHDHGQAGSPASQDHVHPAQVVQSPGQAKQPHISSEAQAALTPLYEAYFKTQMALANDEPEATKRGFSELAKEASFINMAAFRGEAHTRWMEISDALTGATEGIDSAKDIETLRDAFFRVSLAVIDLHEAFGHAADVDYYLVHCPMARNGEGADWLQKENVVWNSFYGKSMLRCGEIKQSLPGGNVDKE